MNHLLSTRTNHFRVFPLDPRVRGDDGNHGARESAVYIITIFVVVMTLLLFPSHTSAQANNKFGIHLAVTSDEDIQKAADLVNSNGGSYGYITLVIQENNRDVSYWQGIFEKLREKKLIPIIRIATKAEGEHWRIPQIDDVDGWVNFLSTLNWIVKDRYIILFNEPNHAAEWGGATDPVAYGKVAAEFAFKLKQKSEDFRIMLAGFDLAAPQAPPNYYDAYQYLSESSRSFCNTLSQKQQKCSDYIDYISSHSYPNPGFRGSPFDTARNSVRGYTYEINWYFEFFGREYPVMITETGWDAHKLGQPTVASYYTTTFRDLWLTDSRVKAVTPFVLNYQGEPFLQFSFLSRDVAEPYPQYAALQSMPKVAGTPEITDSAKLTIQIPETLVEESVYQFPVTLTNVGQQIWTPDDYLFSLIQSSGHPLDLQLYSSQIPELKPFQTWKGNIALYTGKSDESDGSVSLAWGRRSALVVTTPPHPIHIFKQPSLSIQASLYVKGLSTAHDFQFELYDENEKLVYVQKDMRIVLGGGYIDGIKNIVPGKRYRAVLLKPYYLPRQHIMTITTGINKIAFEKMLPLDFDRDGKLSLSDAIGLFRNSGEDDLTVGEKVKLLLPN